MTQRPPQLGYVHVKSTDPAITLVARLYDRPDVTAGYGGWSEVTRPRRRPLSIWAGSPGLRMTLPLLFDAFRTHASIERNLARLEQLATPTAADGSPPRIKVIARGAHVPHTSRTWVIDSLAWGDAAMNARGNRIRQQVTLSLFEYIADVRIGVNSAVNRRATAAATVKSKPGAARKRIIAGKGRPKVAHARASSSSAFGDGEDLLSIAARELGDADRWVEIAQLNGLRDPRAIVAGQPLRMP